MKYEHLTADQQAGLDRRIDEWMCGDHWRLHPEADRLRDTMTSTTAESLIRLQQAWQPLTAPMKRKITQISRWLRGEAQP